VLWWWRLVEKRSPGGPTNRRGIHSEERTEESLKKDLPTANLLQLQTEVGAEKDAGFCGEKTGQAGFVEGWLSKVSQPPAAIDQYRGMTLYGPTFWA
jgi:hypothetical protein